MPKKSSNTEAASASRVRSTCPIVCALDIFGDRWTLLVIRDLMLFGPRRFKDFVASPEGIPTNILTERLNRLQQHGLIEQQPLGEESKRHAYHLTEKGEALRGIMKAMRRWGEEWAGGVAKLAR